MTPRIIIVTGGNSGIGYETVKKILQSDKAKYHVFLGARTIEYVCSVPSCLHAGCAQFDVQNCSQDT